MRPQNIKNFHILVKSRPAGATPLTDFQIFRGFYTSNNPTLVFQISCDSRHRLRSYCGETARRKIRPNFSVLPVGKKYTLDRKMDDTFFDGHDNSITMQRLGKIVQRAPAVGAKMWCLFVCLFVCLLPAGCREAANCRYCFYSQAKNQVFRPAGATRCTDSDQTLQDRRAPGSARLCKISCQSVLRGGNAAPKISKISTFW